MNTAPTKPTTQAGRSARLLAPAVVLLVLTVVGGMNPGDFALLDRLLNHPSVFLPAAAFFLVTAGAAARVWPLGIRVTLMAAQLVLVPMVFVTMVFAYFALLTAGRSSTVPAPKGHAYEAVSEEGTAVIDPIWFISIRQSSGLFAREWQVGCLSGDDPANALDGLTWDGPERLIVQTSERGRVVVNVSPTTGEPIGVHDPGTLGCYG